jgi:fibronectin-binding autotransporter adhesin
MKRLLLVLALGVASLAGLAGGRGIASAATLRVCSTGCPYTRIQDAIEHAATGDTITVGNGTHYEFLRITSAAGVVATSLTIKGAGATLVTIDGGWFDTVLDIGSGYTVSLSGVTLTNGNPYGDFTEGGGVYNQGTLNLSASTVSNSAAYTGGGIASGFIEGPSLAPQPLGTCDAVFKGTGFKPHVTPARCVESTLTLNFSQVFGNQAVAQGGGIANDGIATLKRSTVNGNTASDVGGGIVNAFRGSVTLLPGSLVLGNHPDNCFGTIC